MNGARRLIETLIANDVTVCFGNPGTSEMQMVAALDDAPGMRAILGLFEGVVTGAADGYARMAGKPAATLLHLGPGFGNGVANAHNAKKARSPMVNLVGDHASHHAAYDAPLTADVAGIVGPVSHWVGTATTPDDLATLGAEAVAEARMGRVATLIVPADMAWSDAQGTGPAILDTAPPPSETPKIDAAIAALQRTGDKVLFIGGRAMHGEALELVGRIAEATGATMIHDSFPVRIERGAGRPIVERLPYFAEAAIERLSAFDTAVVIGTQSPVAFFAYPGKPSLLMPEHVHEIVIGTPDDDPLPGLRALAKALHADAPYTPQGRTAVAPEAETLTPASIGAVLSQMMPPDCVVVEEAISNSAPPTTATIGAEPHDWLCLTGGAIGIGLPLATGAAVACPDRQVIALQADGSGLYTVQALWTMARERLDVISIILNNARYAVLDIELKRVGVETPGPCAESLFSLGDPAIDWVKVSEGFGVPARRVESVAEFRETLAAALAADGPFLIDAAI